jgi:signal transduction histidine kinase
MSALTEGPRELQISSASDARDSVLIAVRDSGLGLTPEDFERAFQAFHTSKLDGTGLGLSIFRSIVEAHGGRLYSDCVTCVTCRHSEPIPAAAARVRRRRGRAAMVGEGQGQGG